MIFPRDGTTTSWTLERWGESRPMARGRNALGLDIGSSSIKLVQLKESKKGISLASFSMAPLPSEAIVDGALMNSTAVVDTIQGMISNQKLKNRQVAISISGHSVIIKKISLPAMTPEELDESIKWEAEQYIPFDVNDVYIDYQILQTRPEQGQMDVLLVAAKKEIVDEYAGVVREAGLDPICVGIDCLTIQQCFELNYGYPPGETVVLIDVGASTININVVANGITTFTRDIAMGGNQFTEEIQKQLNVSYDEAEAYKLGGERGVDADSVVPQEVERVMGTVSDSMASEIHRSLDFYMATSSEGRISRIYLSGGTAKVPALARTLENRIGVACELVDPFRGIQIDPKLFNLDYVNAVRPLAAVAVGLGLRKTGDFRINLLPLRAAKKRESGKQFLLLAAVFLVAEAGGALLLAEHQRGRARRRPGHELEDSGASDGGEGQERHGRQDRGREGRTREAEDGARQPHRGPGRPRQDARRALAHADARHRSHPETRPGEAPVEPRLGPQAPVDRELPGREAQAEDQRLRPHQRRPRRVPAPPEHVEALRQRAGLNVSESVESNELEGLKLVRFDLDAVGIYGPADVQRLSRKEIGEQAK
jgi:type IV pilus assembly protein PilM